MNYRKQGPGLAWEVELNHQEVNALAVAATLAPIDEPTIKAGILAVAGMVKTIDEIGGNGGVRITGVLGVAGIVIVPAKYNLYDQLVQAGNDIKNYGDHIGGVLSGYWHTAGNAVGGAWAHFDETIGDAWDKILGNKKNDKDPIPGGVFADRTKFGEWESFSFISLDDDHIAIWSWQGYFCAEGGGGGSVYANRPWIKDWETWRLINNSDGTVSFKSINGYYLVAEEGGGRECNSNRSSVGDWERFNLEYHSNGMVGIKTAKKGTYLSVQP